jgi:putative FmdB family regulatory protein
MSQFGRLASQTENDVPLPGSFQRLQGDGGGCCDNRPRMPTYEYRCSNGHQFEVFQAMSDDPVSECPECGASVERLFHPVAVHFKGSGFYTTDYARKASAKSSSDGGSDSKESTAKESKDSKSDSSKAASSAKKDE